MKKIVILLGCCLLACIEKPNTIQKSERQETSQTSQKTKLTKAFKAYWFNGEAEISSYALTQSRYGEQRSGEAVLIYVTEDFLPNVQVKANTPTDSTVKVLKLNATKNFNTGIYPYSIMQSTFQPVYIQSQPLKISASIQEWCGHVYAQLNNRSQFEYSAHSYFEGEEDEYKTLPKTLTENEIWTRIRIAPQKLPTGDLKMIPSLEYLRLKHKNTQAYEAHANLAEGKYTLNYPTLNRKLSIHFNPNPPHDIIKWEESYKADQEQLLTIATKIKTIKSPYWLKNKNADSVLRKVLQLK